MLNPIYIVQRAMWEACMNRTLSPTQWALVSYCQGRIVQHILYNLSHYSPRVSKSSVDALEDWGAV